MSGKCPELSRKCLEWSEKCPELFGKFPKLYEGFCDFIGYSGLWWDLEALWDLEAK